MPQRSSSSSLSRRFAIRAGANSGLLCSLAKKSLVRLEGHHTTGYPAVRSFVFQEREHGLVAAVDTVKVTDRQGALMGPVWVVESAKYLHAACVIKMN